jgi:cyclopropane fatty-acyl-phospholipid synthase-like methyltransferase
MIKKIRSALSAPKAYQLFWRAVGGPNALRTLVAEHIRPAKGSRILDIGCGPGTAVQFLGACEYTGIDISADYVEKARQRFPAAIFYCDSVNNYKLSKSGYFDRVLALGVVHHLDNAEALRLFETAHKALKPGGKLVTIDGLFLSGQSHAARFLLNQDRGEFIRTEAEYRKIAEKVFSSIVVTIRHDLLRVPYSHIIMECNR